MTATEPSNSRLRSAPAPATAANPILGLEPALVAKAVIGLGLFMGVMPFVGPAVGLPLDGAAWQWTTDRIVLHVIPGALGVLLGYAVLRVARCGPDARRAMAPALRALALATIFLGVWMGAGPWLFDIIVPGAGQSGLMFLGVPGWSSMSPLHQMALEMVCHWGPGILMASAGVAVSTVAAGMLARTGD
ncbi:hypothetical protein K6U06_16995 [Acidiferrimicrobium sp. IK]|uniref:hypothetical protein n=1 Tax=Acidiferrimicrobium sp. IK TaxID=2871700 RepID=UPI0021CAEEE8|nr:hypothetical protein [Acidiferrimicrobium sp. IK]MCU4186069.1 hypothetical protein [Acidiferrimicrobium sp. IK]